MAKIPLLEIKPIQEGVLWLKHYIQMHRKIHEQVVAIVNGQLSFGDGTNLDNLQGFWANVTSLAPGVNQVITHYLGKTPAGALVFSKSAACDVSVISSTSTTITIQSSVAGVTLRLFII